ncbi:MAG: hypothetical protein OEZ39_00310 [Gammaproteobacteria bacterium]|nr:hypothetical protein [Gammaproteobacteria bacterium]MDH5650290.1 hypothetical protein [Gammaproteobacteria bacterium]
MEFFTLLGILLMVTLLPIKFAGDYLGAERTGLGWCFMAILAGSGFQKMAGQLTMLSAPVIYLVGLLLSGMGFALFLKTTYLKGLAIATFQLVATAIILNLFVWFQH